MYSLSKYSLSKYFLFFVFCLLLGSSALAQSTTVSGQVTDSGGQAWNNGTYLFQFIPNNNFPSTTYSWTGGVLNQSISGSLNATGGYSQSVPSNTSITPSGSQWRLQVCSGTNPVNCFTVTQTITGGSQTVNVIPPPVVVPPGGGNTAYVTAEVSPAIVGSQIYILGNGLQICSVVSGGACTLWTSVGSSSPAGPAPPMGYYLSSACKDLGITNPFCFSTPANTQQANLCTYTAASSTVTCRTQMRDTTAAVLSNVATYTFPANVVASWAIGNSITITAFSGGDAFFNQTCSITAVGTNSVSCALVHADANSTVGFPGIVTNTSAGPFTAFDAGTGNPNGAKRIFGYQSCQADSGGGLATNNNQSMTNGVLTISAFVSSLQVTLSSTATNSSGANTGCVIWGNPDDAGAAAMDTAMLSATQCPRAHLAAAYYMVTKPYFYKQPFACQALPSLIGSPLLANLIYAGGFELDGRGVGTTVIYLTPSFPETGSCINGGSKKACFVVQTEGRWSNIMITGGGHYTSTNFPIGTNLVEVDGPGTLEYFTCVNFGAGAGNSVGLALYNWAQISFINGSACGDLSLGTSQPTVSVTAFRVSMESPRNRAFAIGELTDYASQSVPQFNRYNFICYDCYGLNQNLSNGASMAIMRISNGLSVKLYNYRASKYIGALGVNGIAGLQISGTAGGKIDIQDSFLDMTSNGTSTSTGDIGISDQAGAIIHIENSIVKGTSGGSAYSGVAASKFNSLGGNIFGAMVVNAGGLLSLHPTDDLSVATGVTPTCGTVTGATATCAPVAGSTNEKGTLRMTVSAAGTAAGTVTMNFVGTFQQTTTPACIFNPSLTGSGVWNSRATTFLSTRSSTAPVITWDNNAVALGNLTWDIEYSCSLR